MVNIVAWPDPKLKFKAKPVAEVDDGIRVLLDNILTAVRENNAIGLSGNHLGIDLQLVVIAVNEVVFMVNPSIVEVSNEKIESEEGSVSFPGIRVPISRSKSIIVKYLDYYGIEVTKKFFDLEAICIQHEVDQMNGVTILDGLSQIKRDVFIRKMKRYSKS